MLVLLTHLCTKAQPQIQFEYTEIDTDTIDIGVNGEFTFKFKNTGDKPLLICNVGSNCGCLVITWFPRYPVAPNEINIIRCKYDTQRLGKFEKTISVYSNSNESVNIVLLIKGFIKKNNNPISFSNIDATKLKASEIERDKTSQILKKNTLTIDKYIEDTTASLFKTTIINPYNEPLEIISIKRLHSASPGKYFEEDLNYKIKNKLLLPKTKSNIYLIFSFDKNNGWKDHFSGLVEVKYKIKNKNIESCYIDCKSHYYSKVTPVLNSISLLYFKKDSSLTAGVTYTATFINSDTEPIKIVSIKEYDLNNKYIENKSNGNKFNTAFVLPNQQIKLRIILHYFKGFSGEKYDFTNEEIDIIIQRKSKPFLETYRINCKKGKIN